MTKPVLPADLAATVSPATLLVRGGATRSAHAETCEALFMTSGFVYEDAAAAELPLPMKARAMSIRAIATRRWRCSRSGCG